MKQLKVLLAPLLLTAVMMLVVVGKVSAAGWIDHKFLLELPDGSTRDKVEGLPLKGAKIHLFHSQYWNEQGEGAFTENCYYPEKPPVNENPEWPGLTSDKAGYYCSTPGSCTIATYGAPFLPKDFNTASDVYIQGNASYFGFYNKTFTQALSENAPYAYLADLYRPNNIRGFEGARWRGTLDYTHQEGGHKMSIVTDQKIIDQLNDSNGWGKYWGKDIDGYPGTTQRWQTGEVFVDELGGNVLHGRITWVLEVPKKRAEQPSGSFSGSCKQAAYNSPVTYDLKVTVTDLKDNPYYDSKVFLAFMYDDPKHVKVREFLGTPSWGPANKPADLNDRNKHFGYYIAEFPKSSNPNVGKDTVLSTTFNDTIKLGSNQKTLSELIQFLDQQRKTAPNSVPDRIRISANLVTGKTEDNLVINTNLGGYNPAMTANECATAPASPSPSPVSSPTAPMCVSLKVGMFNGKVVTDLATLKPGDRIQLLCGPVTGVAQYKFQIIELNENGQFKTNINLRQIQGPVSEPYTIPTNGGKFVAQCAICPNGNCQAYETVPGLGRIE